MKASHVSDQAVAIALIEQVLRASNGVNEGNVDTVITNAMYQKWQRWMGNHKCKIFGSRVIVIPGKEFISASFKRQ